MRLLVVRHGATANNAEGRFTGQTDMPMSPLGLRQAEAVADALAGERFDLIVASDLSTGPNDRRGHHAAGRSRHS